MSLSCRIAALLVLLAAASASHAMSVVAPTFDQLVTTANVVVRGVVTDVKSETFESPQGQGIRTLVTFQVERVLKGTAGDQLTLSFLGGKVGRRTLTVVGMPTFKVGERQIVFVGENGRVICPVIAGGHGRYHVRHDDSTDRDYVARDNGEPLTSTEDVAQPLESVEPTRKTAALSAALSPDAFETRIKEAVTAHGKVQQP